MAYATLIAEAGPLADPSEAREKIDAQLKRASALPKKNGKRRGVGITEAQAQRMAKDLEGYDSRIQGGRLTGGESVG